MLLPSINSITGVIVYGTIGSIVAAIIIYLFKKFFVVDSPHLVNKQRIVGKEITNVVQSPNSKIIGDGVYINGEKKEGK